MPAEGPRSPARFIHRFQHARLLLAAATFKMTAVIRRRGCEAHAQLQSVRVTQLAGSHRPRMVELSSPTALDAGVGCAMVLEVRVEPASSAALIKLQHPYEAAVLAALQPSQPLTAAYLRTHGRGVVLSACALFVRGACA